MFPPFKYVQGQSFQFIPSFTHFLLSVILLTFFLSVRSFSGFSYRPSVMKFSILRQLMYVVFSYSSKTNNKMCNRPNIAEEISVATTCLYTSGCSVFNIWIQSHVGIYGNEMADREPRKGKTK